MLPFPVEIQNSALRFCSRYLIVFIRKAYQSLTALKSSNRVEQKNNKSVAKATLLLLVLLWRFELQTP